MCALNNCSIVAAPEFDSIVPQFGLSSSWRHNGVESNRETDSLIRQPRCRSADSSITECRTAYTPKQIYNGNVIACGSISKSDFVNMSRRQGRF